LKIALHSLTAQVWRDKNLELKTPLWLLSGEKIKLNEINRKTYSKVFTQPHSSAQLSSAQPNRNGKKTVFSFTSGCSITIREKNLFYFKNSRMCLRWIKGVQ